MFENLKIPNIYNRFEKKVTVVIMKKANIFIVAFTAHRLCFRTFQRRTGARSTCELVRSNSVEFSATQHQRVIKIVITDNKCCM
jgi:hypothetical protein